MAAWQVFQSRVRDVGRDCYDAMVEQFEGVLHAACNGPTALAFLQVPSTASSGLSSTWFTSGFTYGFFCSPVLILCHAIPPLQYGQSPCDGTGRPRAFVLRWPTRQR